MTNEEFLKDYEWACLENEWGEVYRLKRIYFYAFPLEDTDKILLDAGGEQGSPSCEFKIGESNEFLMKDENGEYQSHGEIYFDKSLKAIPGSGPGIFFSTEQKESESLK